jgi:hypothetical protein
VSSSSFADAVVDRTEAEAEAETVARLLAESFSIIARELPAAGRGLALALTERRIRIEIGAELLDVSVGDGVLQVSAAVRGTGPSPDAFVSAGVATILDVLDARTNLRDAVLEGQLRVIAELANVQVLYDALLQYTHAAVRCPSIALLLGRLRQIAAESATP